MSEETRGVVRERVTGRPDIFVKEWFADYLWDLFCPGCQTPVLARMIADALEEMGIGDKAIMVGCVGCGGIFKRIALPDEYVKVIGGREHLLRSNGLSPDLIEEKILKEVES